MKYTFFILLIALLLFSACREEKTEVLSNIYVTNADSAISLLVSDAEVNKIFKKTNLKTSDKDIVFHVQTFINEEGRVDKINITDPVGKVTKQFSEKLAEAFSKLKFQPAVSEGKRVKAQTVIELKAIDITGSDAKWSIKLNGGKDSRQSTLASTLPSYIKEAEFLTMAQQMPEPVGGITAIAKKIRYPEIAKRAGIEGRVLVSALIDEQGDVVYTSIVKGIGPNVGIDEAALEAVKQVKFKPGYNNGNPVKTRIVIPIMFKLQ